jgi:hypothetical protein
MAHNDAPASLMVSALENSFHCSLLVWILPRVFTGNTKLRSEETGS